MSTSYEFRCHAFALPHIIGSSARSMNARMSFFLLLLLPSPTLTLPAGWTAARAPDGRPYWYNATGQSRWDPPPTEPALPAGWAAHTAPDGKR